MSNEGTVLGFSRPAMLGGTAVEDPELLALRWHGTSNYELNFGGRVLLLDAFYDRGPRTRPLGFGPADVVRADAIVVGHPHYDHISDAAQVARQSGAPVIVHSLGAETLTRGGLGEDRIVRVSGLDGGEVLEYPGFTLRIIHALHANLTDPAQQASLQALRSAREVWESDRPPLSADEEVHAAAVQRRGSAAPEVFTEGTMCVIIDIGGYRIVYRDSAGPVSPEERAFFAANPGCDLAIVAFIGRPLVRRQLAEATMPLIEAYQPKVVLPCHHDDLYPGFVDMPTEPLKMSVRERFPGSVTLQPGYAEPVVVSMKTGSPVTPAEI